MMLGKEWVKADCECVGGVCTEHSRGNEGILRRNERECRGVQRDITCLDLAPSPLSPTPAPLQSVQQRGRGKVGEEKSVCKWG